MRNERIALPDGALLARSVRAVAYRAQRTLKGPADPGESRQLIDAICSLERAVDSRASENLSRWLAGLRQRVESHSVLDN